MVLLFLGDIGGGELALIALVALVVLGPQRFPEIARKLGGLMGQFRRASTDLQRQLNNELRDASDKTGVGGPSFGAQAAAFVSRVKSEVAGTMNPTVEPSAPPAEVTSSRPPPPDVVEAPVGPSAAGTPPAEAPADEETPLG